LHRALGKGHYVTLSAMKQLVPKPASRTVVAATGATIVPAMIADAGDHTARRFLEFFAATIRNKNTRMAYYRAACSVFAWLEQHDIGELADIEPMHVSLYQWAFRVIGPRSHMQIFRELHMLCGIGLEPIHEQSEGNGSVPNWGSAALYGSLYPPETPGNNCWSLHCRHQYGPRIREYHSRSF
jgi:hypothetical protein